MTCINLFGGPGTGKSTTASGLFNKMKKAGYKVELVTEYAKDLVYSKSFFRLKDQLYILAKQHHPLFKLESQVDFVIIDSPLLLSIVYSQDSDHLPKSLFDQLVMEMFNSYKNINFYLERGESEFQEFGRVHNLKESIQIDKEILKVLNLPGIPFFAVPVYENSEDAILNIIKELE